MSKIKRRHYRIPVAYEVALYWEDALGAVFTARPQARDASPSGMRVESDIAIEPNTQVCVDVPRYGGAIEGAVKYCVAAGGLFRIGVQFSSELPQFPQKVGAEVDFYEVLQLSSKADTETIHRVYRIMAARFHPDNPESGDPERFLLLGEAYKVLSDPVQRAQYDKMSAAEPNRPMPVFLERAFVDEKEGEQHRRLGVLCLLYSQRRRNPERPTVGLMDLESTMSIPREYLEFTLWYLKQKRYVEMGESADFCLTADGVDFVEEHTMARDLLTRLLASGAGSPREADRSNSGQVNGLPLQ